MNTFFYIIIFIIGTLFGSFYTLAVYRIPKRQDIVYTHSYCPNCNHKLSIIDLFPIFSYILLGGKCRYCKQKIRPRYLILEALSGLLFVIIATLMKLNIYELSLDIIAPCIIVVLYLTYIILLSGINRENKQFDKYVNIYGIVISFIYMIYLCIIGITSIYRYIIYLIIDIILITIMIKNKNEKTKNTLRQITTISNMAVFTGEIVTIITVLIACILDIINKKIKSIENKKSKQKETKEKEIKEKELKEKEENKQEPKEQKNIKTPIGYYMGVINILIALINLAYKNFII